MKNKLFFSQALVISFLLLSSVFVSPAFAESESPTYKWSGYRLGDNPAHYSVNIYNLKRRDSMGWTSEYEAAAAAIRNGFNVWQYEKNSRGWKDETNVNFICDGPTSKVGFERDGINTVSFGKEAGENLGLTRLYNRPGSKTYDEFDIVLNQDRDWTYEEIENVVAHEAGHALGFLDLKDDDDSDLLMYNEGGAKNSELGYGDLLGLEEVYQNDVNKRIDKNAGGFFDYVSGNYDLMGHRLDNPTNTTYYVNTEGLKGLDREEAVEEIKKAFKIWENTENEYGLKDNTNLKFVYNSGPAQGRKADGKITISWGSLANNRVRIDGDWVVPAGIYDPDTNDIILNEDYVWTNSASRAYTGSWTDLQTIVAHEIGHLIGLDHPEQYGRNGNLIDAKDDSGLLMYGGGGSQVMRTLGIGDILGLNRLYRKFPGNRDWSNMFASAGQSDISPLPSSPKIYIGKLKSGEKLYANDSVVANNGKVKLIYQTDGNLVLYDKNKVALWASWTQNKGKPMFTAMQTDGNLVVYANVDGVKKAVWDSKDSYGYWESYLAVQDDGNMVIYSSSGSALWNTKTYNVIVDPNPAPQTYIGGKLKPGEVYQALYPGDSVKSPNGAVRLVYQYDGNLVLYNLLGKALWNTNTSNKGRGPGVAVMQGDGNFVVYDKFKTPLWDSNTSGQDNWLAVQNDNNLVVYGTDKKARWSSGTYLKSPMRANDVLVPGQSITSLNGSVKLIYQYDGNLVLYDKNNVALWASQTNNDSTRAAMYTIMQADGNFVVYAKVNGERKGIWSSNTNTNDLGNFFQVQDDGNMVVYNSNNSPLWNSETVLNGSIKAPTQYFDIPYGGSKYYGTGTAKFELNETIHWRLVGIGKKQITWKHINIKNTDLGDALYKNYYKSTIKGRGENMKNLEFKANTWVKDGTVHYKPATLWNKVFPPSDLGDWGILGPFKATPGPYDVSPFESNFFNFFPENASGGPITVNSNWESVVSGTDWTVRVKYYDDYYTGTKTTSVGVK